MNFERDSFRIDLRSVELCMELDCNTITVNAPRFVKMSSEAA
jgi:hypothetical protein